MLDMSYGEQAGIQRLSQIKCGLFSGLQPDDQHTCVHYYSSPCEPAKPQRSRHVCSECAEQSQNKPDLLGQAIEEYETLHVKVATAVPGWVAG